MPRFPLVTVVIGLAMSAIASTGTGTIARAQDGAWNALPDATPSARRQHAAAGDPGNGPPRPSATVAPTAAG